MNRTHRLGNFVRFSANLRLRFAPFDETSEFRCGRPSSFNDEDPWLCCHLVQRNAAIQSNGTLPPSATTKGCAKSHLRRGRAVPRFRFGQFGGSKVRLGDQPPRTERPPRFRLNERIGEVANREAKPAGSPDDTPLTSGSSACHSQHCWGLHKVSKVPH